MSRTIGLLFGAAAGAALGYAGSLYAKFQASAAVRVRPELAEVGLIQAAATNHGQDWLFYHYPTAMTAATIMLTTLFAAFAARWFKWR